MLNNKGRRVCDAEIGSVKRGWHSCCKPAKFYSESTRSPFTRLDWCAVHVKFIARNAGQVLKGEIK